MKEQNSDKSESEDSDLNENDVSDKDSSLSVDHDERLIMEAKEIIFSILLPDETVRKALKRL